MRYWTHYWANRTVLDFDAGPVQQRRLQLNHTAGTGFHQRGVGVGDVIYIVSVFEGELAILGSMVVDEIVDQDQAERKLGQKLWAAPEHVIAASFSPWKLKWVAEGEIQNIRAIDREGVERRLRFNAEGRLDRQTLRGLRQLSQESARRLDAVIEGEVT